MRRDKIWHTLATCSTTTRARDPSAEAVIFRDQRLTYGALRRAPTIWRAPCCDRRPKGDRVAVLLPNRPEWLVPPSPSARSEHHRRRQHLLRAPRDRVDDRALPARRRHHHETFRGGASSLPLRPVSRAGGVGGRRDAQRTHARAARGGEHRRTAPRRVYGLDDLLARGSAVSIEPSHRARLPSTRPTPCFILYTSGSTQPPRRGARAWKRSRTASTSASAPAPDRGDRCGLPVPLFWSFVSANALPASVTTADPSCSRRASSPAKRSPCSTAALQPCTTAGQHGAVDARASRSATPESGRHAHRAHLGLPEDVL